MKTASTMPSHGMGHNKFGTNVYLPSLKLRVNGLYAPQKVNVRVPNSKTKSDFTLEHKILECLRRIEKKKIFFHAFSAYLFQLRCAKGFSSMA